MRQMLQLATRNSLASPSRTIAAILSVALGVATIVTITSYYETGRRAITEEVVHRWLGAAHLTIYPPGAHWGALDEDLADPIHALPGVKSVASRLIRRMKLSPAWKKQDAVRTVALEVDAVGIHPEAEKSFRSFAMAQGSELSTNDSLSALIERDVAESLGLHVGDRFELYRQESGPSLSLKIEGILASERIAGFYQSRVYLPIRVLQEFTTEKGKVTAIDVMLDDPTPARMKATKLSIEELIRQKSPAALFTIESAEARQSLLVEADRYTRFLLMLVSFIALLTSFFVIITTMSMSLFQRRTQYGSMRAIGMTRGQLVQLVVLELLPIGLLGVSLGVGFGYLIVWFTERQATWMITSIVLSQWGVGLAIISGMLTILASGSVLVFQVIRVTPLAALNPFANAPRTAYLLLVGIFGLLSLIIHEGIVALEDQEIWLQPVYAAIGASSLYFGYIALAPAIVVILGPLLTRIVAPILRLDPRVALDQFGRAPWRSTGICWVLMVGVSLIVYMSINARAVSAIWDFPSRLPEGFLWSPRYVPAEAIREVSALPGVRDVATTTDIDCEITKQGDASASHTASIIARYLRSLTRPVFVAAEPEKILGILKVGFIEGNEAEARIKLEQGGYVLIPAQTAKHMDLHLGDRVTIRIDERSADFEIAGVIQSPALDIAVTTFQATSYMQFAAAAAILGTRDDLAEKFGLDVVAMFMCNFDLPFSNPPFDFESGKLPNPFHVQAVAQAMLDWGAFLPNESAMIDRLSPDIKAWLRSSDGEIPAFEVDLAIKRYVRAIRYVSKNAKGKTPTQQWETFRERLLLLKIADTMGRPDAIMGSLRTLKKNVEQSIQQATRIITWLPSILLVVAIVGIANLMTVSVQIRTRQIAILRAVGALKSQIVRLVLAEAITLALLGTAAGTAMGIHQAYTDNRVTGSLVGVYLDYLIPVGTIGFVCILAIAVCLLAAIGPARYAAKNNIVDAMQTF